MKNNCKNCEYCDKYDSKNLYYYCRILINRSKYPCGFHLPHPHFMGGSKKCECFKPKEKKHYKFEYPKMPKMDRQYITIHKRNYK